MNGLYKRFIIGIAIAFSLGLLLFGDKIIHAEAAKSWLWPTEGEITDVYGSRGGNHHGLDIAAPPGTPIVAAKAGEVTKSYYSGTYGQVVFILHNNGNESVYAHMSKRLVEEGDQVSRGQTIGKVGNTGHSTGYHLHFEIHDGRWNVNKSNAIAPMALLTPTEDDVVEVVSGEPTADSHKHARENRKSSSSKASKSKQKKIEVTVERGDTLWGIAQEYHVPVASLKNWNDLSSDLLSIGQKITVYPERLDTYTVQKGDTVKKIARQAGIEVSKLKKYNDLKDHPIYPHQVLITSYNQ